MGFIQVEDIENLSSEKIDKLYKNYYNPIRYEFFKSIGVDKNFVCAKGMYVYDEEGNKYLDLLGGFGALNLGHNCSEVFDAIDKFKNRPNMLQTSKNTVAAVLANNINYITNKNFRYCFFTNCGTETVEEAIKTAALYTKKGTIIYCKNGYHGKTLGAISALGTEEKYNYSPLLFDFIEVPFGNIDSIREKINHNEVAAVLVEPIQGEGGIAIPSKEYFKELRKLCNESNVVFIMDEIQTGLGRCGSMFCYEKFNVVPDILCLSKSLSGGIIPIGCMCVKNSIWDDTYGKMKYGLILGNTFGGNTLACAAAIKTLSLIQEKNLSKNSEEVGKYLLNKLEKLKCKYDIIKDVRGMGLMIGIEFNDVKGILPKGITKVIISKIISELMNKYHIITSFTINNPNVLRVEPPLIINKSEADYFVDCLDRLLKDNDSISKLTVSGVKNIAKNLI
ncbi:aspartate aminotransferase family protein [Haloimpatiens sp. FM7330]|uniref:aspartate aminotransferase family protein n=1 Tax=Haloimpatiens sp. FM7330 TaxID=3298610 RepID=UPI00363F2D66